MMGKRSSAPALGHPSTRRSAPSSRGIDSAFVRTCILARNCGLAIAAARMWCAEGWRLDVMQYHASARCSFG